MKKLVVIDGHSLAYRAFYAIPVLSNSKGVITNAVYGFTNMLMRIIKQEQPDYLAVAFDVGHKVFRSEQYAEYKAQRKPMPDELRSQIGLIKDVLRAMHIAICEKEGYEGDDVIIVADPFDTTDHNQDGYGVYGAERFIYNFTFYDFFGDAPDHARDKCFVAVSPVQK